MKLYKTLVAGLLSLALIAPAYGAGTIFGLPLSQQIDNNGKPIVGGRLFIYEAESTTPVTVYEDFGLSTETSNPIETDGNGRLPEFWLDDGSYRARFTDSAGVVLFDIQNVTALGASSGEGGGGGSGTSQNAIFTTGMFTWLPVNSTKTGWVRANGRTIGSASSGATERANADTQPLYEWLWANCSNTNCPVSSGRGASASADFAANKTIATLDMRGRAAIGLDTMGNSAASVVAAATVAGTSGGAESSSALIEHDHDAGTFSAEHNHGSGTLGTSQEGANATGTFSNVAIYGANNTTGVFSGGSTVSGSREGGDNGVEVDLSFTLDWRHSHSVTGSTATTDAAVTGTSDTAGSGSSFSIMNPYKPGTWYIRL